METPLERLDKVDENALGEEERLGLAWCRLNYGGWDSLLGPEPSQKNRLLYSLCGMGAIENIIGTAQVNWYSWRFLGRGTRTEWLQWWLTKDFPKSSPQKSGAAPIQAAKAVRRLLLKK